MWHGLCESSVSVIPRTRSLWSFDCLFAIVRIACVCTSPITHQNRSSARDCQINFHLKWFLRCICSGLKRRENKNKDTFFNQIEIIIFIAVIAATIFFWVDLLTSELNAYNYVRESLAEKEDKNNCQETKKKTDKEKLWMNKWRITLMRMLCCLIKIKSDHRPPEWSFDEEKKTSERNDQKKIVREKLLVFDNFIG